MRCKLCNNYYKNSFDENYKNLRNHLALIILRHIQETTVIKKVRKTGKLLNRICIDCLNIIHHKAYDLITEEITS